MNRGFLCIAYAMTKRKFIWKTKSKSLKSVSSRSINSISLSFFDKSIKLLLNGILKNIEFKRIDDIFNLTYDECSKKLDKNYIIYCYTHNIDKMKMTSDIGLIPIKSLSEILY